MPIRLKRVYDNRSERDGYRVLVDRLWPRGLSRQRLDIDQWLKETAPSNGLRRGLHRGEMDWGEFRRRYLSELKQHRETLRPLARRARRETVTLLFTSRNQRRNNAVVLKEYLERLGAG